MTKITYNLKSGLPALGLPGVDLQTSAMNMVRSYHNLPQLEREYLVAELIPGSGIKAPQDDPEGHLRAFLTLVTESGPTGQRPSPDQVLAGIEVYMRAPQAERQRATILARMVAAMWIADRDDFAS